MIKKDLQTEQLDRIARKLLETTKIQPAEIERISGSPTLFESVKSRINSEQTAREAEETMRWSLFAPNRRITGAAFAAFAILALTIFGLVESAKPDLTGQILASVPEIQTSIVKTVAPVIDPVLPEPTIDKISHTGGRINATKKIITETPDKKPKPVNKPLKIQKENVSEFYALTYTGNSIETEENLHIVRVELPRSSLFALGVNIQLENEPGKIKTDLLVGSDGVTRAIRFVK